MASDLRLNLVLDGEDRGVSKMLDTVNKGMKGVGGVMGDIAKTAAGFALGGAITQLPGLMLDMAKSAAEDEKATARLSQTLKNLPGDFDQMTGAVNAAIKSGQTLAFSDDDIRDSFQFLATATGDSSEALKRQKVALDLARGANIPLAQASKLVGKVNAENVDTFKKLGINIKEGASEAEALAEVQAKFAGQAEAYANSTAGQFEAAQLAFGEIQESIGSALLPVLAAVGKALADNLPMIQEVIGGIATGIADVLVPALAAVQGMMQGAFQAVLPTIQPLLDVLPSLGQAISQAFGFFTTGGGDIEVFRGVLTKLVGSEGAQMVVEVFTNMSGFFRETVIPMFKSFGEIVGKVLKGDFGGAIEAAAKHIATFGPKLVETLADWTRRFIEWVAPMIPPLLLELGKVAVALLGWIAEQIPPVLLQLGKWALQFIEWVAPLIPPLLLELGKLAVALLGWVAEQIPPLLLQLAKWALEFIKWVGPMIPPFLLELAKIAVALLTWAGDQVPKLLEEMAKWAKSLWEWVAPMIPLLAAEIVKLGVRILEELAKIATGMWESVAGGGADSLKNKLGRGLREVVDYAAAQLTQVYERLVGPFQAAWNKIEGLLSAIRRAYDAAKDLVSRFPGIPGGGGGSGSGTPPGGGGGAAQSVGGDSFGIKSMGASGAVGGTTIIVNVSGSVVTEGQLVDKIHTGLLQKQRRNGTLGLIGGA